MVPVLEAGAGLRQGCAFGIAEDDFDFDAGRIAVRRQIAHIGGKYYFKLPKGGKARTVPMSSGAGVGPARPIEGAAWPGGIGAGMAPGS